MKQIAFMCSMCLLLFPVRTLRAETGEEIMENVLDNQQVTSSAMDIQMTLLAPGGRTSVRRIQTLVIDNEDLSEFTSLAVHSPSMIIRVSFGFFDQALITSEVRGRWPFLPEDAGL